VLGGGEVEDGVGGDVVVNEVDLVHGEHGPCEPGAEAGGVDRGEPGGDGVDGGVVVVVGDGLAESFERWGEQAWQRGVKDDVGLG
jgi:hypothetical protein